MPHEQEDTTKILLIPDYDERIVGLLPSQFRKLPRWDSFMRAIAEAMQLLEETTFSLIVSRSIKASSGAQLDQWGRLVGEARGGATDLNYRPFIETRIFANNSKGTTDEYIQILQTTTAPSTIEHTNVFPACAQFNIRRAEFMGESRRRRVRALMDDNRPAGVCFHIVESTDASFGFLGSTGLGFGAGTFARVL